MQQNEYRHTLIFRISSTCSQRPSIVLVVLFYVVCFGLTFAGWHDSVVAAAWKFVHLRRSAVAAIACKLTRVLCMGCGVAGADPPDPPMSTWPALTCGGCWQRGFSHEWASHPRHHPRSAAALPGCVPRLENHQYPLKKGKKAFKKSPLKKNIQYSGKKKIIS